MLRTGLLSLNGLLLLACGYLLATTLRALVFPTPIPPVTLPEARPIQKQERSFDRYREIATRELFGAGPAGGLAPEPVTENIEESQLTLRLIGTAYAADPVRSVAVLLDESKKDQRLVVRSGARVPGTEAEVARIERGRLILNNRGRLEEIKFPEEQNTPSRTARTRANRGRNPSVPLQRSPLLGGDSMGRLGEQIEQLAAQAAASRSPEARRAQSILTQARIVPRYGEDGSMSGLEVNAIRSGSLLEQAGFENGDLVVAVNGAPLSDPAQGLKVFRELATAERFVVEVARAGGVQRLEYAAEEP